MIQLLKDFISLFYPEVCLTCGEGLAEKEEFICASCFYKLPKTDYHNNPANTLYKAFYGRAEIVAAAAFCFYAKGGMVQDLVHEIKYKGKKELGTRFGKWYGLELKNIPPFSELDVIIPVPLHPKKLKRRGYNQSACFAEGLSESMKVAVLPNGLKRIKDTETQTNKSRFSRWENVKDVFIAENTEQLRNKHVLLVDDIITTGATMEACIHALNALPVASVSVASIGYVTDELV
jgi:ComF family protein